MSTAETPFVRFVEAGIIDNLHQAIIRVTMRSSQWQDFRHQAQFLVNSLRMGYYEGRRIIFRDGANVEDIAMQAEVDFGLAGTMLTLGDIHLRRVCACFSLEF